MRQIIGENSLGIALVDRTVKIVPVEKGSMHELRVWGLKAGRKPTGIKNIDIKARSVDSDLGEFDPDETRGLMKALRKLEAPVELATVAADNDGVGGLGAGGIGNAIVAHGQRDHTDQDEGVPTPRGDDKCVCT